MTESEILVDEESVRSLRTLLAAREELPMGMRSRFEARLKEQVARDQELSWGAILVVGAIVFTVAGVSDITRLSAAVLPVLVVCVAAYARLIHVTVREPAPDTAGGPETEVASAFRTDRA